jgi:hypothetical protein
MSFFPQHFDLICHFQLVSFLKTMVIATIISAIALFSYLRSRLWVISEIFQMCDQLCSDNAILIVGMFEGFVSHIVT